MDNIFNNSLNLYDIPKEQWSEYIGLGYRSVCYRLDEKRNGQIVLFGFDRENNRKTFVCPHKSYIKYKVKYETTEKDVFGNFIETKYFNNIFDRKKYIDSSNGLSIIECMRPESEFLLNTFKDHIFSHDFNKQNLRVFYLDIETEISDKFMMPSEAGNRINMITVYDSETKKFYTWSLLHADVNFVEEPLVHEDKSKFVFFEFDNNEMKLLKHFVDWYSANYPDVIVGYNTKAYDMPYIVRRLENLFGSTFTSRISPVQKYRIKEVNHDNERADVSAEIDVTIDGLFNCDLLILYRDKFNVAQALDGGYSLDNVGEYEGLGHKIKYDGTLKDLYLNDYQKFYEYNVRDVDLVKRLDDKKKLLALSRQIISYGITNYDAIYSSIGYLSGSVTAFARTQMNGKIFNSYLKDKRKFESFEGAFVFPIEPSIYRGGIACIDFASLYPSNIRSINASPETYVGKLLIYRKDENGVVTCNTKNDKPFNINSDDEVNDKSIVKFELKLPNEQRKRVTIDKIRELVKTKCIYTTNNTLFLKHEVKWGVIAKWCEYFYNLRKSVKKEMLKNLHILHNKNDIESSEKEYLRTLVANLDNMQLAIKCMINSIYGMFGTQFSSIGNPDIAQTITRQGRFCNQSTTNFIFKRFQELYDAPHDYKTAIGGDTDSVTGDTNVMLAFKE